MFGRKRVSSVPVKQAMLPPSPAARRGVTSLARKAPSEMHRVEAPTEMPKTTPSQGAQGSQTGIASAESKQAELAMMKSNPEKTVKPMQDRMPSTGPAALSTPKPLKKGGSVGSASRRADGIAQRGKTKGRMI